MARETKLQKQLLQYMRSVTLVRTSIPGGDKYKYKGMEDFVLKNGKFYPISKRKVKLGRIKECFSNAAKLAIDDSSLIYCEGYFLSKKLPIPIYHAWVIDREGKVIDNTIRVQKDEGTRLYYGVEFSTEYLCATVLSKGTYGLIDNWEKGYPLITGKDKEVEWKKLRNK